MNVDVVDVAAARVEAGIVRLMEAEREPADSEAGAETKANAEARSAEPSDERRSIERTRIDRTRAPAPTAADVCPTTVVIRSEAPRLIANPRPTPRADVVPSSVAIRSPTRGDLRGIPNISVVGLFVPGAVVVEIGCAGDVRRDVFRGDRIVVAKIALGGPAIEAVGFRRRALVNLWIVSAFKFGLFAGVNGVGLAAGGDLAFAANCDDRGGVAIFRDVHAKGAGLSDREREIRCVYFVDVAFAEFPDAEIDCAFRDANLHNVAVEIQEREGGHAAQVDRGGADLKFGARRLVGPKLVADGDGAILCGGSPLALTARLEGDGTVEKTDARDARWRIWSVGVWSGLTVGRRWSVLIQLCRWVIRIWEEFAGSDLERERSGTTKRGTEDRLTKTPTLSWNKDKDWATEREMVFIIGSPVNCRLRPTGILLDAVAESRDPSQNQVQAKGSWWRGRQAPFGLSFRSVKHGFGKEVAGSGELGTS